jgi:hypothetical protein
MHDSASATRNLPCALAALRAACFIVDLSQSIRAVETCWDQDIIKVGLALKSA